MLQTHLLCLPPPSPRSTTSSWAPCTACFVSPYNKPITAVLIHAWMTNPNRYTISSSAQSVFIMFPYRYTVPHGQLHPATCCISQAVDLEASRVLHHQSLHQWPWDDTLFIPAGNYVILFTQVSHIPLVPLYLISPIWRNMRLISLLKLNCL